MTWWVAVAAPQKELKVADRLTALGVEVYCPTHRVSRRQVMVRHCGWRQRMLGHRISERTRPITDDVPIFPRYLFANTDQSALVSQDPDVVAVVRSHGGDYQAVPDEVMSALQARLGGVGARVGRRVAKLSEALRWKVGDRLRFRNGAFDGLELTLRSVARLDETGVVSGFVNLLGSQNPLNKIHYTELEAGVISRPTEVPAPVQRELLVA